MTTAAANARSGQPDTVAEQCKALSIQTIHSETGLVQPLAHLVMQYLPSIEGWITEWSGERGREIVTCAVTKAETPLSSELVDLVVEYVKKSDIFGLEDLEKAAGGKEELRKLIGKYDLQNPPPLAIDDEMQTDLSQLFDTESLNSFPGARKVTDVFSLYWCPRGITARIMEELAKKSGQRFHPFSTEQALKEHGNTATQIGCWIQFPNQVFGRNKTIPEQEALTPAGFEFPHLTDAIFCVFLKYLCSGARILVDEPLTYTRLQEQILDEPLVLGSYSKSGNLHVNDCGSLVHPIIGVALVRKHA